MANVNVLQTEYVNLLTSLYLQGNLDGNFAQLLQNLQDEENPLHLIDVPGYFFDQADLHILRMKRDLLRLNVYFNMEDETEELLQSCSTFGALRARNLCRDLIPFIRARKYGECILRLYGIHDEIRSVRIQLRNLFRLENAIRAAGGEIPVVNPGN